MRLILLLNMIIFLSSATMAQNTMNVHLKEETRTFGINESDSVYFSADRSIIFFVINNSVSDYAVEDIDSITFDVSADSTVYIEYNGTTASVINPLENMGVDISVDGADVIVRSSNDIKGINYILAGSTTDGMFKLYSSKSFNLLMDGVSITNQDGPAINIQTGKKAWVNLMPGTTSILTDGTVYADPVTGTDGTAEDQGAAFFSEGELIFIGSGSLVVNGNGAEQHGIRSDDYIQIDEGSISVKSASKDGLHGREGFYMHGGTVDVTASGDGIDSNVGPLDITAGQLTVHCPEDNVNAIHSDTLVTINGGTLQLTVEGDQSKGIDSNMDVVFQGGDITIETSGGVVLEASGSGYDPSYCTAVHCNGNITFGSTDLVINSQGIAGRGFSCNGNILITDGNIEVQASGNGATYTDPTGSKNAYHGVCINADGALQVIDGILTLSNSGSGGKGINTNGDVTFGSGSTAPVLNITTTGAEITISSASTGGRPPGPDSDGEAEESKALKSDGAVIVNNGTINISSADDGIKSTKSVTFNKGTVNITRSYEGVESPLITVNGGNLTILSSDDGFNATKGNGGEANDGSLLSIHGGYSYLNATKGDPVDSNGNISITSGTMVVHGPEASPEVGMDVNGTCLISGGFIVISGTDSNMTEGASSSSTQNSLLAKTYSSLAANTIFHIEDSSGNDIVTFAPVRRYYSIVFSSFALTTGNSYSIYTGGTSTGDKVNGLYTGGTYSGGTLKKTFTISGTVTNVSF